MDELLYKLNLLPGILGSLIIEANGIIIASNFTSELNEEKVAAVISATINAAQHSFEKLGFGEINNLLFESYNKKIFINTCNAGFLVIITKSDINIGLVRTEAKSIIEKINTLEVKM